MNPGVFIFGKYNLNFPKPPPHLQKATRKKESSCCWKIHCFKGHKNVCLTVRTTIQCSVDLFKSRYNRDKLNPGLEIKSQIESLIQRIMTPWYINVYYDPKFHIYSCILCSSTFPLNNFKGYHRVAKLFLVHKYSVNIVKWTSVFSYDSYYCLRWWS